MSTEVTEQALGFSGGGELGELIRSFDWSATALGPLEEWPDSLRTAVRIMLASSQPIWIGWGEDLIYLYNDAYKSIIGGKHPEMLGLPTRTVWSEIWDVIEPMLQTALTSEQGIYVESQLLIMERYGYREETYYTFSYSPIPGEDGRARGIICVNTDDTQRRIGERQLATVGEVAAKTTEVLSPSEVCRAAAEALATNPLDLPFALLYLAADDDADFSLSGASGVEPGDAGAPLSIVRSSERATQLGRAFGGREIMVVDEPQSFAPAPTATGAWSEAPTKVAYVPLAPAAGAQAYGVLVVGLNPHRLFDTGYSDFLSLIGRQVSSSLATAFAYEGERRRAEALAQLDEAKTQFFSNVSHEFRTPLTLMLGPLEDAALQSGRVIEIERESLAVLRRNALRLLRMVNTILDFSRVSSGQAVGSFRQVDLAELTREVGDHFRPLMERSGIELELDVDRLDECAYVDPEAWEKIVLNLLSNAFKFTLSGHIRLSLAAVDGTATLQVVDTGTGIPEEELPHLFERFHRIRNDQARTYEGTGIGLALVRELVELHGGTVTVDSVLGEGTTFTVRLPLGHEHLPAQRVSHEPESVTSGEIALAYTEEAGRWSGIEPDTTWIQSDEPLEGDPRTEDGRVVVVDDNADMRDYMVRLLERHWPVDAFADGQSALDAIRRDPPKVVVTDVMMPRLDGIGLLAALREDPDTAPIPVIMVSARAGEESSVEGLHAGADDYLVKPFSARELVARVRANLELSRLRAEAGRLAALEDVRARVVTTVSHELRTPVTAIFGASRTLAQVPGLDEQTRSELLQVIVKETERLARITNDILTTESLVAGVSVDVNPVDVRLVVADAVRAAEAGAPPGTHISTSFSDEPIEAVVDPSRLQQVVTNLLDNAIKYSPSGAEVEARLLLGGDHITIEVVDQGVGIPEEVRDHVFRRFYRVDPTLTGGVGGSGLGLYISRQLIEAMGGSIRAEGNAPRGSRFVVTLPRAVADQR